MSHPSLSNYYGSAGHSSSRNTAYSTQSPTHHMYPSSIAGTSNAQQSISYGNAGYGYPVPSPYADSEGMDLGGNEAYSSGANYGYQRGSAYDNHDASLNDAYSQGYYNRNVSGQSQSHHQSEGLSNLAYASGLESANTTSSTSRSSQGYGSMSQLSQQNRVRSPTETQSQFSAHSPTAVSYPMQHRASTSSQIATVTSAASSATHGTASPLMNRANSQPSYPGGLQASRHGSISAEQHQAGGRHRQNSFVAGSTAPISSSNSSQHVQRQPFAASWRTMQDTGSIADLESAAHDTYGMRYTQDPAVQDNVPTFINPTAIFDPYQREREQKRLESERAAAEARRKAEEEARAEEERTRRAEEERTRRAEEERARKAEEEAQRKKQQEEAAAQRQQAVTEAGYFQMDNRLQQSSAAAPLARGEGDAMAEIKAMMEKVKAFQSQDPSLFKKLWNDMRQPAASTTHSSISSPLPRPTQQSLPLTTAQIQSTPAPLPLEVNNSAQSATTPSGSSKRKKATWLGADGHLLRANGYPAIVENNPEGLPDLGRFPAERRIRPNKYKKHQKGGSLDESAQSPTGDAELEPPAFSGATPTPAPSNKRLSFSSQKGQVAPAALTGVSGGDTTTSSKGAPLKQHSGTVWPVEKWNALTSTALRFLKSNPENASIVLTEDDVHKMLENNPSYINLCEMLEQRGLKFHRGHFARELLDSVPDLKPSSGQPQAQKPAPVSAPAANNSQQIPAPVLPLQPPPTAGKLVPVAAAAPAPAPAPAPPPPSYKQSTIHPAAMEYPPAPAAYKTPKAKIVSTRPVPPPGSKEAAARKRDFSELIDLTEIDDENYVVPEKHPRLDGQDSDVEMEDNHFQAFPQQALPHATQPKVLPSNGWVGPSPQPMRFDPYVAHTGQPKKQDSVAEAKASRMILAKTLDKNEALKKQYYDPRTVARDILIASGRHPSERPLNVHLAGMLGKYIELDSDVSTFEWDEIDPGGPPLRKEEYVDVPASRPRFKMGDRVPRRLKTRHKIEKTRRPDQEKRDPPAPHSTAWSPAPQPPPLPPPGGPPVIKFKNQKPSGLRYSLLASDEHATPATLDPTRAPIGPAETKQTAPTIDLPLMDQTPPVRKRGRPPGSKNKYSNVDSLKDQAAAMAAIRINIPPRDPNPPAKENYKCKWRKCSTVLHNLDTLKKHIEKIHNPSKDDLDSEGYTCWWKKCPHLKQSETGEWIATKAFKQREEWLAHIEREHITPIALKYGDGPSTIHTDPIEILDDRLRYLSNDRNQLVSPMLKKDNSDPPDVLNLTEGALRHRQDARSLSERQKTEQAHHKKWLRAHNKDKDARDESKEVLRAMTKRKENIGPGIDRGGCTLINEEMRQIFVQNPGVRRIIGMDD